MPDDPFGGLPGGETTEVVVVGGDSWTGGLFKAIRDRLMQDWADQFDVDVSDLPMSRTQFGDVLKEYGAEYHDTHNAFPDYLDVAADPIFNTRVTRRITGVDLLPDIFTVGDVIYENRPDLGPSPVAAADPQEAIFRANGIRPHVVQKFFNNIDDPNIPNPELSDSEGVAANDFGQFEGVEDEFRALVGRGLMNLQRDLPEVSEFDLNRFTQPPETEDDGSGGRGRLAFDRNALQQGATDLWGRILWEAPPSGLVDEYIDSANSLYQSSGVQQGFESWMNDRMAQTAKWGVMYGRMEPGFTPLEWQNRFNTSQFGLRLEDERAQSIRGMSSGAAPASFQQSVEQSRDVQSVGQGRFSQRFANHINQLGRLQNR